jgi:hypothetical protein
MKETISRIDNESRGRYTLKNWPRIIGTGTAPQMLEE